MTSTDVSDDTSALPEELHRLEEYGPADGSDATVTDTRKLIRAYFTHLPGITPDEAFQRLLSGRGGDHLYALQQRGEDARGWFEREWTKVRGTIESSPRIRNPEDARSVVARLAEVTESHTCFRGAYGKRNRTAYLAILKLAWKFGRTNPLSTDSALAEVAGLTRKRFMAARKALFKQGLIKWNGKPNPNRRPSTFQLVTACLVANGDGAESPPWEKPNSEEAASE
jgi:hypothetical protein